MADAQTIDPARLEALHAIVKDLHAGKSVEEVKPRFEELIQDVEATEIAAMEQKLIEGGVPDSEVKRLCDVHVQVFADALEGHEAVTRAGRPPDGHVPAREPGAAAGHGVAAQGRRGDRRAAGRRRLGAPRRRAGDTVERLAEIDKHYLRKENQLFPFLEDHGVEGPSKVMWAIHDDIRALIKQARQTIADGRRRARGEHLPRARQDGRRHGDQRGAGAAPDGDGHPERRGVDADPRRRGRHRLRLRRRRARVAGGRAAAGDGVDAVAAGGQAGAASPAGLLDLNTGGLSLDELNLVLGVLPIDFQYVDEHDRVRFYSEGHRIFPRSPGVIGRKVQNCHPPASVHKVQQIIDAFRAGEKDDAEFWIEMQGKFLHIRYFAVRDEPKAYRGVVETVQDVTGIRALEGQRRLLDW